MVLAEENQNMINSGFDSKWDIILIEDQDQEYTHAISKYAANRNLKFRAFVDPLTALNWIHKYKPQVRFIIVDYFLPKITGAVFIKQASKWLNSNYILYSISGEHILHSLEYVPVHGVIKKYNVDHFIKVLHFYISDKSSEQIFITKEWVLLPSVGILYNVTNPESFVILTKAENIFLSTFRPIHGVEGLTGFIKSLVSASTVWRLNNKLKQYNVSFRIKIRLNGNYTVQRISS